MEDVGEGVAKKEEEVPGRGCRAARREERRRGRKPEREAVPPVRRRVEARGMRRSMGSYERG